MGTSSSAGKVTIIVVTYNNLEFTRLTLESVLTKTRYPRFEVVVVDNGSEPDMQQWLTSYASKHSRIRVILNETNLGFPAANNVGIRAASQSDYIVLLNNDCIVTPGWLTRLIRYLEDPKIGIVGPVTNFAGNEACINPDYYHLEDIDRFARLYSFSHRGRSFDIPMLAMFCLAMRHNLVDEIGLLDEQFGAGMFEDDDYAWRVIQAGYRVVCAEDVYVHHFGRSSFSKLARDEFTQIFEQNRSRFEAKWGRIWTPPRPRPDVIVLPWTEYLARREPKLPPWQSRRALAAPLRLAHEIFRVAVPYERRLIFWSWRRRNTFQLRQLVQSLNVRLVSNCRAQIRDILAQHPDSRGTVIFPPSVPWHTELFQRPQQMALAFAALGYVVLYWVEDIDEQDESSRFRKVAERVYLCQVPPAAFSPCRHPIFIAYTYNYNWVTWLKSPTIVYELIDHLDIFSNFPRRMLERYHRRLLRRASVVVGTADGLLAELKPDRDDAILVPNGVDLEHFAASRLGSGPIPDDMRSLVELGAPIIGYYGAMAEWFDFELLKLAAEALPEYEFVLIGPDYDGLTMQKAGIESHSNIHWLGPKKYVELPQYLACFDVATIPFKVSDALDSVSPIKLFEYMAGGRPIVTTNLAECRKYPVVLIAHTPAEWISQLREATVLRDDEAYLAELRRTAEKNTWQARAETIVAALEVGGQLRRPPVQSPTAPSLSGAETSLT